MTARPITPSLPHQLNRTVVIRATPEVVFSFFTESSRWAQWWGAGSTIDPRPGGAMFIRYPDGTEVRGEILEVRAPECIAFTYGFVSGKPIAPGSSHVTIQLAPSGAGTRLDLKHEFAETSVRDEHVQGWRYQLSLFANIVSDYVNRGATDLADAWFDLWAEPDPAARARMLAEIADSSLAFHDRFSNIDGAQELLPHIAAAQHFMPGFRMRRVGDVRHCQGIALADWAAFGPDGVQRMTGTNVFVLGPLGRIESVTGIATAAPAASG